MYLSKYRYNNTQPKGVCIRINLPDLEAGRGQKLGPLILGTLHCARRRQHGQVRLRRVPVGASHWQDDLIEKNHGILTHGGNGVLQDLDAFGIGIVVKDCAKVVILGPLIFLPDQISEGWLSDIYEKRIVYL